MAPGMNNTDGPLNRRTMPVQMSRPLDASSSRSQIDEIDQIAEGKLAQDLFGLPAMFNDTTIKRNAKEECTLCQTSFSVVTLFGLGTKEVVC